MHEFSIASALVGLLGRHVPEGAILRKVLVRVGPLQAIEPQAMETAWMLVAGETVFQGAELALTFHPWRLRCRECGQEYESPALDGPCPCGATTGTPAGGAEQAELTLVSLEIDEPLPLPK